jgi:hypothetical protein
MSIVDQPEVQAAITEAKRGFIDAIPKPISYEVFVTRLRQGNITKEAIAEKLTDIPSMGLRFMCASCRGPAAFDATTKAAMCFKAQNPCGSTPAEYTIMPKLEIRPNADVERSQTNSPPLLPSRILFLITVFCSVLEFTAPDLSAKTTRSAIHEVWPLHFLRLNSIPFFRPLRRTCYSELSLPTRRICCRPCCRRSPVVLCFCGDISGFHV